MSEPRLKALQQMTISLQRYGESSGSVSFNFEIPSEGLSLRGVSIVDGVPRLVFDASDAPNSPTITEEDVAVVARLVTDGERPEFYFIPITPGHPYFGRQYEWYKTGSSWMRTTSVGKLLAKIDWIMKCLSIGAKTNEDKTEYWSVDNDNDSNLEGHLCTTSNFPSDASSGSIIMSPKSVKVEESENDQFYVGDPEVQIIDDTSPAYSEYITKMYDRIAHHYEPLYLKMKELIKLILAMEFLKDRGIQFDSDWYMSHTSGGAVTQAVEVSNDALAKTNLNDLINRLAPPNDKEMFKVVKQTKSGFQVERRSQEDDIKATLTVSVNDYDLLYEGFDPQQPVSHDGTIIPDVSSWSELYRQTVPWPQKWIGDLSKLTAMGGVSTRDIPKAYVPPATTTYHSQPFQHSPTKRSNVFGSTTSRDHVTIEASDMPRSSGTSPKMPRDMMPVQKPSQSIPSKKVGPQNPPKPRNKSLASCQPIFGYKDPTCGKAFNQNGEKIADYKSIQATVRVEKDGKTFGMMGVVSSNSSTLINDSGYVEGSTVDEEVRFNFVSPIGSDDEMMDHD